MSDGQRSYASDKDQEELLRLKAETEVLRLQAETEKLRAEARRADLDWREQQRRSRVRWWRGKLFWQVIAAIVVLGPPVFFYTDKIILPIYQRESIELGLKMAEERKIFHAKQEDFSNQLEALSEERDEIAAERSALSVAQDVLEQERDALARRIDELGKQYQGLAADNSLEVARRSAFEHQARSLELELEVVHLQAQENAEKRAAREAELLERIRELEAAKVLLENSAPPRRRMWARCSLTCGSLSHTSSTVEGACGWCDAFERQQCCITCGEVSACSEKGVSGSATLPCGSCTVELGSTPLSLR